MKRILSYLLFLPVLVYAHPVYTNPSPQPFFNVREYGAKADGQTNDALAINKAIQAA
ncbi:MAG: hypothetical protein IRZ01_10105, partial [Thermoflavifilum aggregans]|nr:hypothetical protein [Thermoflavifilum aggregans]